MNKNDQSFSNNHWVASSYFCVNRVTVGFKTSVTVYNLTVVTVVIAQ